MKINKRTNQSNGTTKDKQETKLEFFIREKHNIFSNFFEYSI